MSLGHNFNFVTSNICVDVPLCVSGQCRPTFQIDQGFIIILTIDKFQCISFGWSLTDGSRRC